MKLSFSLIAAGLILAGVLVSFAQPEAAEVLPKDKYTCVFDDSNPFPDGTTGIAEVSVKVTGNGSSFVSVEYFSDNYEEYLGQYQESDGAAPMDKEAACTFAAEHFDDI